MIIDFDKERARGRGFPSISLEGTIENIRNDPYNLSRMRATLFAMRHALFSILRQVVQVICPQLIVGILADAVERFWNGWTQRDDTLSFGVTWIIGIIGGGRFVLSVSGTVNENGVARLWIIVSYGL